jgi:hypothetical protein
MFAGALKNDRCFFSRRLLCVSILHEFYRQHQAAATNVANDFVVSARLATLSNILASRKAGVLSSLGMRNHAAMVSAASVRHRKFCQNM